MVTREDGLAARRWYLVDAQGQGARSRRDHSGEMLRGKGKPQLHPTSDSGDFVVIVNAAGAVDGEEGCRRRCTTVIAAIREAYDTNGRIGARGPPDRMLRDAVEGMLPEEPPRQATGHEAEDLPGSEHPHAAQQPVASVRAGVDRWQSEGYISRRRVSESRRWRAIRCFEAAARSK